MIQSLRNHISHYQYGKIISLVLLSALAFAPDFHALMIVKVVLGFLLAGTLSCFIIRKTLFKSIDLSAFGEEALKGNVAAALVFLSLALVMSVTFVCSMMFFI